MIRTIYYIIIYVIDVHFHSLDFRNDYRYNEDIKENSAKVIFTVNSSVVLILSALLLSFLLNAFIKSWFSALVYLG